MGNTGLKLISVVLALVLWTYVRVSVGGLTHETMSQLELQVPLEIRGASSSLIPYEKSAGTIKVTLRGDSAVVSDLREGLVRAYVDVSDMVAGTHWPEVQVLVPQGVDVLVCEPKSVNVKLSPPMSKSVPLVVEPSGDPKKGFRALNPSYEPRIVRLQGPEAILNQVQKVVCLVPVGGLSETLTLAARNLAPVNSDGNILMGMDSIIRMVPREVMVTLPIEGTEVLHALPVLLDDVTVERLPGYSYNLEVFPQFVQVRGSASDMKDLPVGLSTSELHFSHSSKRQEKEVGLIKIPGLTLVGNSIVKVRLTPVKQKDLSLNLDKNSAG